MANSDDAALQQSRYHQWLASKNVHVRSDLVETTQQNVVAGWGCVAKANIKEGTLLFRIPRSACFIATKDGNTSDDDSNSDSNDSDDDSSDDPTTKDTQKDLAMHLLKHKHSSTWAPFLDLLTPQSLPWTWTDQIRECLKGTELEQVVHSKILRIQAEYASIQHSWDAQAEKRACISYQEYLDATSIVASHANPWFGVSIVPFNTTLNWGSDVNVEFDLEETQPNGNNNHDCEEVVVGRAVSDISKGSELFQQYGESVAELVYRCGFAPKFDEYASSDSISLYLCDIVRIVEKLFSPEIEGANSSPAKENHTKLGTPTSSIITHLPSRIEALKKSGAIDTSPWDGMDECLSAELSSPSSEFMKSVTGSNSGQQSKDVGDRLRKRPRDEVECEQDNDRNEKRSSYDDGGISKLIGICLVLAADGETWQRSATAMDNIPIDNGNENEDRDESESGEDDSASGEENETESRSDDIAASVLLASLGNLTPKQSTKLQQRSLDVGMGGHDPWRALLLELSNMGNSKTTLKWEIALEAAKVVIQDRMDRLMGGEESCQRLQKTCPEEQGALETIHTLQLVEKSLLSRALKILDIPFR
ncbi:hypothetical protein HJC23_006521 [Cyclotella cryptica]|uniref:SET domain-containing protein n=1 Tax=Cyclotella cryptica TaxID=29204 RepID=A0ABD3P0X5_9STRA|eukprot:CCRYP_018555-RA/>CCRYP_018555-RA protein AED:0.10 eAED:0.08 QI:0/-1/0/1/-1/1/1/0/590